MATDSTKSKDSQRKMPAAAAIVIGVIVLVGIVWGAVSLYNKPSTANYAEEVAKPLEKALAAKGAVKNCSRGSDGRGTDNNEPWYYAIYEVPGNREAATSLVRAATQESGYSLKDGTLPASPEDNKFYADETSKRNTYTDLADGNIDLQVTVFGSSTYTGEGDQFCTVTKRDNPPTDKTTIRYTINLPSFRR